MQARYNWYLQMYWSVQAQHCQVLGSSFPLVGFQLLRLISPPSCPFFDWTDLWHISESWHHRQYLCMQFYFWPLCQSSDLAVYMTRYAAGHLVLAGYLAPSTLMDSWCRSGTYSWNYFLFLLLYENVEQPVKTLYCWRKVYFLSKPGLHIFHKLFQELLSGPFVCLPDSWMQFL